MASDETDRLRPTSRTAWIAVAVAAVVVLVAGGVAAALRGDDPPPARDSGGGSTSTAPARGPDTLAAATATDAVCRDVPGTMRMDDGMVMAAVPQRAATAQERAAADALVARVGAGLGRFADLPTAVAAGYVPATDPARYVVHYANWDVVRRGDVLDASSPSSLVYANTVDGPVLLGAMFMGPGPCRPGPDIGGPLTEWHAHDDLCLSATRQVVGRADAAGSCATGRHNVSTFFMLHVWTAPSLAASYQFETHLPRPALASIIRTGRG